jgi:sugar phosphate isomerase/epimerase
MQNVIVPLNAFGRDEVLENGQLCYIEAIANAGAYGVEIRRELLPDHEKNQYLDQLKQEIARFGLFTVYSAPIELWKEDTQLNTEAIEIVFHEAQTIGAKWLKVSLGHYQKNQSNLAELGSFLGGKPEIQLLVENDQTMHGGNVQRLKAFFESALEQDIPVQMTFDVGNWFYTGQKVEDALRQLSAYVHYLHLKQVEKRENGLVTLPLQFGKNNSWEKVCKYFPPTMIKATEFPIQPIEKLKEYIQMLEEGVLR